MSHDTPLAALRAAACLPPETWPARYPGLRAIGVLCSYVPDEMLHAAGLTPVRLRAAGRSVRQADAHLPSYTCALCKSTLDQHLAGELSFLAGTVFAHTCDTMQALADLWQIGAGPSHWVEAVMQPANLGSPASRAYLVAELRRFRRKLEVLVGRPIADDDLRAAIDLYDETRRLVQALARRRDRLAAPDCYAVLDAAQGMPRPLFNRLLAALLAEIETAPPVARGAHLFLAGAVLDEPRLIQMIDELGAQVVGDDLCSASRRFVGQVGSGGDPIERLAGYFQERPPCPAKRHPAHDAARHLLEQLIATDAQGVVFLIEKYCEPHAFEHALLRPALEQAGVPYLVLELEQTPNLEGLRTRLEAFLEML